MTLFSELNSRRETRKSQKYFLKPNLIHKHTKEGGCLKFCCLYIQKYTRQLKFQLAKGGGGKLYASNPFKSESHVRRKRKA